MKELSIEWKAKRYDEILVKLQEAKVDNNVCDDRYCCVIDDIVPELAESEDEKIRKELLNAFKEATDSLYMVLTPLKREAFIAWLEKQGQTFTKKDIDDAYLKGVCDAKQELTKSDESDDERIRKNIISWLKNIEGQTIPINDYNSAIAWLRKQGEQKLTDKIEPKFHEGEWITNGIDATFQVRSIEDNMYLRSDDYFIDIETADKKFRLWTIQDAKDGDVLNSVRVKATIIFKGWNPDGKHLDAYCALQKGILIKQEMLWDRDFEPATKKQRDTLMKAMADAGYTFDFDKKELKQIKQKPTLDVEIPFGTDSELVEEAITIPDGCCAFIEDNKVILRKGEKKSSWSEEDEENFKWFEKFFRAESVISGGKDIPQDRYLWFKNLKDRVQP